MRQGLADYTSELERCRVLIRLMCLGIIYREFCDLARDEWLEPYYKEWAEDLDLSSFRTAQLVGPEFEKDDYVNEDDLLEWALNELIDKERNLIIKALRREMGGDAGVFVSLWKTIEDYGDDEEAEYEILNDVSFDKMRAYEWIEEGIPRIR